ncbi:RNA recognition motif domain-containing protein [uncultured Prochlorococcus sp.]|jgi:RNA recognition motif-containing protein|uniref:RNA recognition motif domain-containing protein n=1 Tax=Prochlorococcus sp. TaxID=1220 RepID=UPI000025887B|nr:RNA-binding protein [uncultured Prochlorococcus sp.]|tara:strand:+ start:74 stop:364 length:291 start_codon:yes stop_codon:yes gene_type:complete
MTIFVGNLSWDTEEEDLRDLFNTYGEVTKCTIPLERDSGRKRGFGFVEMTSKSSEKTAIDDLQDVEWMGREIRVNKAEQKDRSRRNNRHHGSKNNI